MSQHALPFSEYYLMDEDVWVNHLLEYANSGAASPQQIKQLPTTLVENVRHKIDDMDDIYPFMKEYDLS